MSPILGRIGSGRETHTASSIPLAVARLRHHVNPKRNPINSAHLPHPQKNWTHLFASVVRCNEQLDSPTRRRPAALMAGPRPQIHPDPRGSNCSPGFSSPPPHPQSPPARDDTHRRLHIEGRPGRTYVRGESPTALLTSQRTASPRRAQRFTDGTLCASKTLVSPKSVGSSV